MSHFAGGGLTSQSISMQKEIRQKCVTSELKCE